MLSDEQEQESQELIPTVQDAIIFNGKPLIVVRLSDGRPGGGLRWICENLNILSPFAQIESGFKELLSQKVGFWTVGHQPNLTLAKVFHFKLKYV